MSIRHLNYVVTTNATLSQRARTDIWSTFYLMRVVHSTLQLHKYNETLIKMRIAVEILALPRFVVYCFRTCL